MSKQSLIVIGLLIAAMAWQHFGAESPIVPQPKPVPVMGAELVAAFGQTDDRTQAARDAKLLGHVCNTLAEIIADDAKLPEPRLTSGIMLDDLRRDQRIYTFRGRSLGETYPALPAKLKSHLDATAGDDGGTLTPEQRAKWCEAFGALAKAGFYAAGEL